MIKDSKTYLHDHNTLHYIPETKKNTVNSTMSLYLHTHIFHFHLSHKIFGFLLIDNIRNSST